VWLGLALLAVDAFFLLADMLHRLHITRGIFPTFAHPLWEGDPDGSLLEIWGYVKAVAGLRRAAVLGDHRLGTAGLAHHRLPPVCPAAAAHRLVPRPTPGLPRLLRRDLRRHRPGFSPVGLVDACPLPGQLGGERR